MARVCGLAMDGRFNAWLGSGSEKCETRIGDWTLIGVESRWRAAEDFREFGLFGLAFPVGEV